MTDGPGQPKYGDIGACLLHGEYHEMQGPCWEAVITFYMQHPTLTGRSLRNCYMAAYETKILDEMIRTHKL